VRPAEWEVTPWRSPRCSSCSQLAVARAAILARSGFLVPRTRVTARPAGWVHQSVAPTSRPSHVTPVLAADLEERLADLAERAVPDRLHQGIPTRLARQQIAAMRGKARASLQTQAYGLWCAASARIRLGSVRASFWASPPAILAICRFPDAPISPAPHPDALGSPVRR